MTKEREMIESFIAHEIETNEFYKKLHKQLKKEKYVVARIYDVFLDYFDGYFSVWTIMNTIERYLRDDEEQGRKRTIEEIVDSEDFEIIDR